MFFEREKKKNNIYKLRSNSPHTYYVSSDWRLASRSVHPTHDGYNIMYQIDVGLWTSRGTSDP